MPDGNIVICDRLRTLREEKKLSQGDIEKRTGLPRCYISRVENGHTVPSEIACGSCGTDTRFVLKSVDCWRAPKKRDRKFLLSFAQKLTSKRNGRSPSLLKRRCLARSMQLKNPCNLSN
jgi:predicted transcriptional regulator